MLIRPLTHLKAREPLPDLGLLGELTHSWLWWRSLKGPYELPSAAVDPAQGARGIHVGPSSSPYSGTYLSTDLL